MLERNSGLMESEVPKLEKSASKILVPSERFLWTAAILPVPLIVTFMRRFQKKRVELFEIRSIRVGALINPTSKLFH